MSETTEGEISAGERVADQLEAMVLRRLEKDELILPVLSGPATKCMELVRKPDYSVAKVAEVIESDPILAARILRVVNSAGLGNRQQITSLQAAVSRLGSRGVYTAVVEATSAAVFESREPRIAQATRGLWQHSVAVALASRDLSIVVAAGDPEECYLAGLLHDVGKPVLAVLMLDAERQILAKSSRSWLDATEWLKAIARSHRKVGVALAKKWQLPESIITGIAESGDYDSADRRSIANVVRFSNALAKQQGIYVGLVDKEEVNALIMIGRSLLELEDDAIKRIASGLLQKMQGAT